VDDGRATQPGLDPDELRAEQAGDLPERDAMSVIGIGGITGGLPPADILDGVLESDLPASTLPVDGLPVELYPVDRLPVDGLPVETLPPVGLPVDPPDDTLPIEPPIGTVPIDGALNGDSHGIPGPPPSGEASVNVRPQPNLPD
jgi:hypothetical protein